MRDYVSALIDECEGLVTCHRGYPGYREDTDEIRALAQAASELRHLRDRVQLHERVARLRVRSAQVGMAESDQ